MTKTTNIAATSENVPTTNTLPPRRQQSDKKNLLPVFLQTPISQFCHPRRGCCIAIPRNLLLPDITEKQKQDQNKVLIAEKKSAPENTRNLTCSSILRCILVFHLLPVTLLCSLWCTFAGRSTRPLHACLQEIKKRDSNFTRLPMTLMQTHNTKPKSTCTSKVQKGRLPAAPAMCQKGVLQEKCTTS